MSPHDSIPQIDQMRLGVDYRFTVSCRGLQVLLRPLTITESVEVANRVVDRVQAAPIDKRHQLLEHSLMAIETLEKASTDRDGKNPQLSALMLGQMTNDELLYLHKQYEAVLDRCNPSLETLPTEQIQKLVEEVKKNPSQLTELSTLQLRNVASYLITQAG